MAERSCSLVLAAHGSLATENANQSIYDLAHEVSNLVQSQLEAALFSAVRPAFLKGEPEMTTVLATLIPGDVVIVPVMTSDGYYSKKLPGKIAANKTADDFRCLYSPVVGVHPSIPNLISNRISKMLAEHKIAANETTIVLIGHGTHRNETSGLSTIALTEQLKQLQPESRFMTGFLDQEPNAVKVAGEIQTRHTLVIPFLISRGPHSTVDVPEAFGLPSGPDVEFPIIKHANDGLCICDLPVGMYPEIADVCLQLATETLVNAPANDNQNRELSS